MTTINETTPAIFSKIQEYLKNNDPDGKIRIKASAYGSSFFISFFWNRNYNPDVFNNDKYFQGVISNLATCRNKEIFPFIENLVSELYMSN